MTNFESALVAAAKTFLSFYSGQEPRSVPQQSPYQHDLQPAPLAHPTPTSNGIPVCERHGKAMVLGQFGYYCQSKESDPNFANKNGYCKTKVKQ